MTAQQFAAFAALEEETRRLHNALQQVILASGEMPPETTVLREIALTLSASANIIRTTLRAVQMRIEVCEPNCPFKARTDKKQASPALKLFPVLLLCTACLAHQL